MAIVEVTVIPIGTETTSLSGYVADLHRLLEQAPEPIQFQMTPMSTIIEGELQDLFQVLRRLHEAPFQHGAQRVSTSIKIDDRRDKNASMEQKLRSVRDKLQS
ncbi:MTH1187 family thiamine-binding protein [Paenibacillus oleatilyticus]|uniref:MTH1187 family thiamine-binding protein n=1 Tax=Paenibacillus oleatilyticus TaxID=2594886 RepID=UPI001C2009D4|nr:MTH1187 family thiamine-binding protein [Paenibacillus oleatilyticus]MBU7317671.1 MTH1187 family thiamine-binding protein [Paenibacillus oleatilyticus]